MCCIEIQNAIFSAVIFFMATFINSFWLKNNCNLQLIHICYSHTNYTFAFCTLRVKLFIWPNFIKNYTNNKFTLDIWYISFAHIVKNVLHQSFQILSYYWMSYKEVDVGIYSLKIIFSLYHICFLLVIYLSFQNCWNF